LSTPDAIAMCPATATTSTTVATTWTSKLTANAFWVNRSGKLITTPLTARARKDTTTTRLNAR